MTRHAPAIDFLDVCWNDVRDAYEQHVRSTGSADDKVVSLVDESDMKGHLSAVRFSQVGGFDEVGGFDTDDGGVSIFVSSRRDLSDHVLRFFRDPLSASDVEQAPRGTMIVVLMAFGRVVVLCPRDPSCPPPVAFDRMAYAEWRELREDAVMAEVFRRHDLLFRLLA